jgi:diguanylate cyclase (GGDEF)-like protein
VANQGSERGSGAFAQAQTSPFAAALTEQLATSGGIVFIYRCLNHLVETWSLRGALAIIEDPAFGRQVFNAGRRPLDPGWARHAALRQPPGVYTDPAVVDAADDLATAHNLCTVAFKLDQLHYQSMHDALTGLYNRRGFDEHLVQAVSRSARYGWGFSLVLIDLNRFKSINDELGHPGGDAVLRAVGDRLRRSLRGGDVAGRIGGDEFALLLPNEGSESVPPVLRRLQVEVGEGNTPEIELSVGVASCPEEAQTVEALYQLADQRLYESKRD